MTKKDDTKTCRECGRLIYPGDGYYFVKPRRQSLQFYCSACIKEIKKKEDKP